MTNRSRIIPAELLGKGGESEVYALDDARVVRIYKPQIPADYIERRRVFYARLHQYRPAFEVPLVLDSGSFGGRSYSVERRMCGRVFAAVFPTMEGAARRRALTSYLDVAEQIGIVTFDNRRFGEMLTTGEPLQRDSWTQYVWDRLQQTYRDSRRDVEQDVPEVEAVLAHVRAELRALEGFNDKCLVHGDYFPGNVYIDERHTICGVGDFGYTTVVGDPRLDLAGAVSFVELVDGYRPDDSALLMQLIAQRHGPAMLRWIELYRLFYSFYFSGCKADDPPTYDWCINNLRTWLQEHT